MARERNLPPEIEKQYRAELARYEKTEFKTVMAAMEALDRLGKKYDKLEIKPKPRQNPS